MRFIALLTAAAAARGCPAAASVRQQPPLAQRRNPNSSVMRGAFSFCSCLLAALLFAAAPPPADGIHAAVVRLRHHQLKQVLEQSTSVTLVYYFERIEAHKFTPVFEQAAQQMLDKYGNRLMFQMLDLAAAPIARRMSSSSQPAH